MASLRRLFAGAALCLGALAGCHAQNGTTPSLSVGMILFPGFALLDVYGPLELLSGLSYSHSMKLSLIANETGPVSSLIPPHVMVPGQPPLTFDHTIAMSTVATHTFADAPRLDVLIVPGGMGNMALDQDGDTSVEDFIAERYGELKYLLSVCTGSVSLAKAGVLEGKKATTNKSQWGWVTQFGEGIDWVPTARWTVDDKIWTSSGVSSGIDRTYAFVKHLYGEADDAIVSEMNAIEYAPHTNRLWDPYSVIFDVPGADKKTPMSDCVKPVGI